MSTFGTLLQNNTASPLDSTFPSNSLSGFYSHLHPDLRAITTDSLFTEDFETSIIDGESPWNTPIEPIRRQTIGGPSGKPALQRPLRMILSSEEVPGSYIDAFDLLLQTKGRSNDGLGLSTGEARRLLHSATLSSVQQSAILQLMNLDDQTSSTDGLGRNEFHILLALIGLAQEGGKLSLDVVAERRETLPTPRISYLEDLQYRNEARPHANTLTGADSMAFQHSQLSLRRPSQQSLDSDPWADPSLHHGHNHDVNGHSAIDGFAPSVTNPNSNFGINLFLNSGEGSSSNWGSMRRNSTDTAAFSSEGGFGGFGFGHNDIEDADEQPQDETVTISTLPEKEGLFMFQHRNYEVKTLRRGSSVIRRYSDFVWLVDCLQKRYPFRQIPLLPPKRVALNGAHLVSDSTTFIEKRRRGLVRFTNALVRHPVLSREQLVTMFLTVPTELAVWRKQATISAQDEFIDKPLPELLEESLPQNLSEMFDKTRSGIVRSAESYIHICNLFDRLVRRNEGFGAEQLRVARALQGLTESIPDTYTGVSNEIQLLNSGIMATATHLMTSQTLLGDESQAWNDGMLEDLKRQRDRLISMREMFDRRDRLTSNTIPQLEQQIEANEKKLEELRGRREGSVKPGEIERFEQSLQKDKQAVIEQRERDMLIQDCIRQELFYFNQSQYDISQLHKEWCQERVKYAELQADNWRSLIDQLDQMPSSD